MVKEFTKEDFELLHFIFDREFKPPFRKSEKLSWNEYIYYNRNDELIGWLRSGKFYLNLSPFMTEVRCKSCKSLELNPNDWDWLSRIRPHLISWLEDRLDNMTIHIY